MTLQTAARVPFHPLQCPVCTHYMAAANRCRAYAIESPTGTLLAVLGEESVEACPRFETNAVPDLTPRVETPAVDGHPDPGIVESPAPLHAPPETAAVEPAEPVAIETAAADKTIKGTPMIHCAKCKAENPPSVDRCQRCNAMLLPSEGAGTRLSNFVMFMIIAAVFGYLLYRWYIAAPGSAPNVEFLDWLINPITLGLVTFLALITGLTMLLRRTPEYVKYSERAKRHEGLNPWQALNDLERAMDSAPDKEQGGLLKRRGKIYEKVGMQVEAARDFLTLATAVDRFKGEADAAKLLAGADSDVYARGRRSAEISAILKAGTAIAVGYCKKCGRVVVLDIEQHCPLHPKVKGHEIEYVIPADELAGKLKVMQKVESGKANISAELSDLVSSGKAIALGVCPKCRAVVELDARRHCKLHPKARIKNVEFTVPELAADARKRIFKAQQGGNLKSKRTVVYLLAIVAIVYAAVILLEIDVVGLIRGLFGS